MEEGNIGEPAFRENDIQNICKSNINQCGDFLDDIDSVKLTLDKEEERLILLEEKRTILLHEIDLLEKEIIEEKKSYRVAIDKIIEERSTISKKYLESFDENVLYDMGPLESSLQLIQSNKDLFESDMKIAQECEREQIDVDTESLKSNLLKECLLTKEKYLDLMQEHLNSKDLTSDGKKRVVDCSTGTSKNIVEVERTTSPECIEHREHIEPKVIVIHGPDENRDSD